MLLWIKIDITNCSSTYLKRLRCTEGMDDSTEVIEKICWCFNFFIHFQCWLWNTWIVWFWVPEFKVKLWFAHLLDAKLGELQHLLSISFCQLRYHAIQIKKGILVPYFMLECSCSIMYGGQIFVMPLVLQFFLILWYLRGLCKFIWWKSSDCLAGFVDLYFALLMRKFLVGLISSLVDLLVGEYFIAGIHIISL